jgi:hypothetical protein
MIFGYARVSTDAQDLTAQLKDLKAAGCERVFKEKVTGATAERPQLKKLLAEVGHGDVVIIAAVDRLSRDTTDLLVIARDLQKAGAGLRSLAEPVVDTTSDFAELVLAIDISDLHVVLDDPAPRNNSATNRIKAGDICEAQGSDSVGNTFCMAVCLPPHPSLIHGFALLHGANCGQIAKVINQFYIVGRAAVVPLDESWLAARRLNGHGHCRSRQ